MPNPSPLSSSAHLLGNRFLIGSLTTSQSSLFLILIILTIHLIDVQYRVSVGGSH
ncbi:unnamed protein product [Heterobilharzia americana]|nr:unnamed protein product [Heterobilharzia americana]